MPGIKQGRHLLFPGSAAERPAVNKHHWFTRTVVLVVKVDGTGVSLPTVRMLIALPF